MLVFYPTACTVVNYSNTFELNLVKHHLFTSWVSNAADIPSISCSCQIILRVSDHGQNLRDWVHRYNAAGLAGLRKSQIARSRIKTHGAAAAGRNWPNLSRPAPTPAVHRVVRRWRLDLRDELQRRFGVALHERSAGNVRGRSRRWPRRWSLFPSEVNDHCPASFPR